MCDNVQSCDYMDIDQSVITAEVPSEADFVSDLRSVSSEDDEGNVSDCAATISTNAEATPPTNAATNEALNTVVRYLISRGAQESVLSAINIFQMFVAQQVVEKQSKMTDFFLVLAVSRH